MTAPSGNARRWPAPATCGSCRFFGAARAGDVGQCRRLPPVVAVIDHRFETVWPLVQTSVWCGEFQRVRSGQSQPKENQS